MEAALLDQIEANTLQEKKSISKFKHYGEDYVSARLAVVNDKLSLIKNLRVKHVCKTCKRPID